MYMEDIGACDMVDVKDELGHCNYNFQSHELMIIYHLFVFMFKEG